MAVETQPEAKNKCLPPLEVSWSNFPYFSLDVNWEELSSILLLISVFPQLDLPSQARND